MTKQVLFLFFTILLLGLFTAATPIPIARDAAAAKRELKQFKLKRGDPEPFVKRADAAAPAPSGYYKRDTAAAPKPST
ncbi:hypothetical protein K435DRAFT_858654 [Dendrothele bispora CBS 962.96]|uniref:Uncharacterized protein n=1 Tax=Dendrothele bispora (strain CBS 962.96) TaxID=1314807 RepID=A0A4S8M3R6_DENBC|nr:hypothetical protein K435DRAFT_858654 [Dendrothele bispora CBS 962.96]